jgi:hypothetical protein
MFSILVLHDAKVHRSGMLSDSSSSDSDEDHGILARRNKGRVAARKSSTKTSSGEADSENVLKINQKFARKYEEQQRFKDLQRAKDLLADADEEEDSESESEDENAEALDTKLDLQVAVIY